MLSRFENLAAGYGFELAGLTLRGPAADGSCVAVAPGAAAPGFRDAALSVPINFGEDVASSCTLQLTPAQLASLCTGAGGAASPTAAFVGLGSVQLAGAVGAAAATHVGVLGNADPYKPWQWLALAVGAAPQAPSWDTTGVFPRCSNIVSGVDVELLVAPVGAANNPQFKVVAARVTYPTATWTFGREDGGGVAAGAAQAQSFLLTSTVTFTKYEGSPAAIAWKPAPPIIPPMPADLWYPSVQGRARLRTQPHLRRTACQRAKNYLLTIPIPPPPLCPRSFVPSAGGASQIYVPANGGAGSAAALSAAGVLLALAAALRLAVQ